MARVKRGVHSKKKHKAVMDRAKGFRGARSRRFKVAKEAVMHAERYAYRDRRARKGDFRRLWITRINAAARMDGLSYSRFMHGLKLAEVTVDRKVLADMAVREPAGFSALVAVAKDALGVADAAAAPSGGPTSADAHVTSSSDLSGGVAGTSSVDAVRGDEIVDAASAPVEEDEDAAETAASDDADEAEVEVNVLVESDEHDEVDLTDDASEGDEAVDAEPDVTELDPDEVEAVNERNAADAEDVAVDVDQQVEAVDASDDDADDDASDELDEAAAASDGVEVGVDDDVSLAQDATVDSDDDGSTNAEDDSPFGEGSAKADDDGAGPEGWTIKGNADSMLFHTEDSPYYGRTKAEVWFETEAAAAEAGFERWDHEPPADDDA